MTTIKIDKKATDYLKEEIGGEGGTTVVANPELVGDEPELTGLEVEGTKYKVPEGGSGTDLGLQFQPTSKVLKPFADMYEAMFRESCNTITLDSTKLKQIIVKSGYDLDTALTIPTNLYESQTAIQLNFTINVPTLDTDYSLAYIKHLDLYLSISIALYDTGLTIVPDDGSQLFDDNATTNISSFSGSTLEDLLDYMITNNINVIIGYNTGLYGEVSCFSGQLGELYSDSAYSNWYNCSCFSNIALYGYNDANVYYPHICYIDIEDFEDALIYTYPEEESSL